MKILFFALALFLVSASTALACSGTQDYPKAVKALEDNQHLDAEQKSILLKDLMAGMSMHDDGHKTGDMSKMGQSLQTLRSLKPKITN